MMFAIFALAVVSLVVAQTPPTIPDAFTVTVTFTANKLSSSYDEYSSVTANATRQDWSSIKFLNLCGSNQGYEIIDFNNDCQPVAPICLSGLLYALPYSKFNGTIKFMGGTVNTWVFEYNSIVIVSYTDAQTNAPVFESSNVAGEGLVTYLYTKWNPTEPDPSVFAVPSNCPQNARMNKMAIMPDVKMNAAAARLNRLAKIQQRQTILASESEL